MSNDLSRRLNEIERRLDVFTRERAEHGLVIIAALERIEGGLRGLKSNTAGAFVTVAHEIARLTADVERLAESIADLEDRDAHIRELRTLLAEAAPWTPDYDFTP